MSCPRVPQGTTAKEEADVEKEGKEAEATAQDHSSRQQAKDAKSAERRQEIANIAIGIIVFAAFFIGLKVSFLVGVGLCVFVFFVFEK